MTKDKQIEEMAKAIYNLDHCEGYKDDRGCMYAPSCSVCKYGRENKAKQISELLAKQGYRKASEVAREIIADLENGIDGLLKVYLEEREKEWVIDTPIAEYVSGKIDAYSSVKFRLAELKKKYTEGEKDK